MSVSNAGTAGGSRAGAPAMTNWLRDYFWSENARRTQTVLGLIWALDGGLQFQSFMYSRAFPQMLVANAAGEPGWLHDSIIWGAKLANGNLGVWNSLFALTQVLLGLGLLYRPLVKPTLAASFAWVLVVWWFGEAFGMMFTDIASPLTGAPGCVVYALVGLVAWPNGRPGGLLGARGARTMWAALWLVMAWLYLLGPNSGADATANAMIATDSGIGLIWHLQNDFKDAASGIGLSISLVLAALCAAIGIAVAANWRPRLFLWVAAVLVALYWIVPQGLGGLFAGGATDPNTAPLFALLAYAMWPVVAETRSAVGAGRHQPVQP